MDSAVGMVQVRWTALYALSVLTIGCLVGVVVLDRTPVPTAAVLLSSAFHPQTDAKLDKAYRDALAQARAIGPIESAGFQLANLDPDPLAAEVREGRQAKPPPPQVPPAAVKTPPAAAKAPAPPPPVALAPPAAAAVAASPRESAAEIEAEEAALSHAAKADRMVEAAKDLERAARYEMASAQASPQKFSGKSILSAFADEVKKLSHLTTQSSKKEKDTGSWDAVEVSAMSSEVKKLDGLVEAIKGGKKPKDIVSGAQDSPSEDMGADAKAPHDSKEFEEKQQAKLSDAASRKDLDSFFDAMSLPEDDETHVHDVGDTYDRLKTRASVELKEQHKEINKLEQLVVSLVDSKERAAAGQQAAVRRGRAKMGVYGAPRVAAPAFAGILKAAAASEQEALEGHRGQLPGVNVADWFNGRAERASESQMLQGNRFADRLRPNAHVHYADVPGMMDSDEGGSQLASFSLAPKAACPPCGFLPSCRVNPDAKGFSRASGLFGAYPSAASTEAEDAYGGGTEDAMTHPQHTATLRQMDSGGMMQSEAPLWTKLPEVFGGSSRRAVHARRLLARENDEREGGQMLASFTLAPPPSAAPRPPKCVCPSCKLGDEQVGWEDEHHGMLAMPMNKKVDLIDEELMKLDPSYAIKRSDPNYNTYSYPFVNNHAGIFAKGVANPLSDFHEDNRAYFNQVATKDKKTIW